MLYTHEIEKRENNIFFIKMIYGLPQPQTPPPPTLYLIIQKDLVLTPQEVKMVPRQVNAGRHPSPSNTLFLFHVYGCKNSLNLFLFSTVASIEKVRGKSLTY